MYKTMYKQILKLLVLVALMGNTAALKLELFDSTGFLGPYLTASNAEACTNLTTSNFIQQGRSLKTDTCIMIFRAVNCTSHSIRLDPGEYSDLAQVKHETVNFLNPQSYRLCSAGEGGQSVNVDIHGHAITMDGAQPPYSGILLKYRDVCSCINLPTKNPYIGNVTTILNYGNCIKIYPSTNCTGSGVELLGGVSPQSQDLSPLGSFIIPSTSIGLCSHRPSCYSLNNTAFKFQLSTNEEKRLKMSVDSDLALTSKAKYVNNGTATVTHDYEARKIIKETVEVTRVTQFSSTDTYSTVRSVVTTGSVGFLFWRTRIVTTLTEAYTKTSTSQEENGEKFTSEQSREIALRQTIQIPPCSEYEVDSFVTMTTNYPVDYNVYFYVSGESKGNQLSASEVMERLTPGLSYVEDYDNFTVIAVGSGTIVADLSSEAVMQGEGAPIHGCTADDGFTLTPYKI